MALQPTVLEGAFAALLGDGARADVVQFQKATPEETSAQYDVAIVTDGLPHEVNADVLITLPDTQVIGGDASVTVHGTTRPVKIQTNQEVIDLLSDHFPQEIHRPLAS